MSLNPFVCFPISILFTAENLLFIISAIHNFGLYNGMKNFLEFRMKEDNSKRKLCYTRR